MAVYLEQVENTLFREDTMILFVPLHPELTIEYVLLGTRTADSQVKTIPLREVEKEGNVTDLIGDAFLHFGLEVCFWRQIERQNKEESQEMDLMVRCRVKQTETKFFSRVI